MPWLVLTGSCDLSSLTPFNLWGKTTRLQRFRDHRALCHLWWSSLKEWNPSIKSGNGKTKAPFLREFFIPQPTQFLSFPSCPKRGNPENQGSVQLSGHSVSSKNQLWFLTPIRTLMLLSFHGHDHALCQEREGYRVELLIKDPPKKRQHPNKRHTSDSSAHSNIQSQDIFQPI